MKKQLSLLFIIISLSAAVYAAKPASVQYIFPPDQSQLNSRAAEIILRPGDTIDEASLFPELFQVRGEKSGEHSGRVVLSTDDRTIIFKPHRLFHPEECVHVRLKDGLKLQNGVPVASFDFSFNVSPLEQPINPHRYRKELDLFSPPADMTVDGLQKTAAPDSLPLDFPSFKVTITGEPSPGDIFFSPTRFVSKDGYNLRLSWSGELKYYQKINDGIPFDFKVLSNGMLSYGIMYEVNEGATFGPTDFIMIDSSYQMIGKYQMGNGYVADYHEFLVLPNGHVFMISYDIQPVNMNGIVPNGHPGALVAGGIVQELDQNNNVIFQWRSWDHYNLTDSYHDLSQPFIDAIHLNSIDLDSDGHLILSALALAEITKIDRQTGEIIWRMGGANNQFSFINESQEHAPIYFMYQHDVRRLPNGNITMFDNGDIERRPYSRVVEYAIDEERQTATKVWEFRRNPDVYSNNMGNAQRLANGNTFIGWGFATMHGGVPAITEVDAQGNIVFELTFDKPLVASYRAFKFTYDSRPVADVLVPEVQTGNSYDFDRGGQKTGLSIKIIDKDGFGYNEIVAKLYDYAPFTPAFVAKAPMLEPSRIVLSQFNIANVRAELSFDVDFYQLDSPQEVLVYHREFEGRGLFLPLPTVYNPATNKIVATMTKFGEFVLATPDDASQLFSPWPTEPSDGQDVDQSRPVHLQWTPVGYATEYTLQIAKKSDFSDTIVEEQYITDAFYDLDAVEQNADYYWRVKSYNDIGESDWSPTSAFHTRLPFIKLTAPGAGSKWRRGLEYYIIWDGIIKEDVILELYKDDAFIMVIDTVINSGGYKWDIPLHLDAGVDYRIKIMSIDNPAVWDISQSPFTISDADTDIRERELLLQDYELWQNSPNPFNPSTLIRYQIPQTAHVTLKVYDIRGSLVATLVDEVQSANRYDVYFDASQLASGIYIYTFASGDQFSEMKKMLLVK
ncbi:aryl-sulfate sulfotransferase [candidate division KSB1 bacterium]|nr:aryl-sulfate sulfotransferase [candidate division KSB1 bacterium]